MAGSDCKEMIELGDEWGMKYEAQFIVDPIARDRPRSENGDLTLMGSKGDRDVRIPLPKITTLHIPVEVFHRFFTGKASFPQEMA
ncbi:MAG: hypothetical protein WBA43_21140 [Elainellaceae cyanobacterium]